MKDLIDDLFQNDLLSLDEAPRYDGIRRLLHLADADITAVDTASCNRAAAEISLDRLSELALALGIEPEFSHQDLGDLMLRTALFAFEAPGGALYVFAPGPHGALECVDPVTGFAVTAPPSATRGRTLFFGEAATRGARARGNTTLGLIFDRVEKTVLSVVGLTFASNLLGLALPLFTLTVYDQILTTGDVMALAILIMGLGIGIGADALVRVMRSAILARASARADIRLSTRLFGRMIRSPQLSADLTSLGGAARMRDANVVRDFFLGPVGVALVEAPFSLVYVGALAILGGWLALVPIAALVLGGAVAMPVVGALAGHGRRVLARAEDYGSVGNEIATRFHGIRIEGSAATWLNRFTNASARLAEAELVGQRTAMLVRMMSTTLVSLTVLATLVVGALSALDGAMSVGALIASIALVWRMSAPLPAMLQARLRWGEMRDALRATDAVLATELTRPFENWLSGRGRGMAGKVALSSVSYSYRRGQTAAIRNASVEIGAGELVVLTGHSGSGKSTLLDLISGGLEPQFGAVTIDGINPQQVSPSILRQSLAYLPRDHGQAPIAVRDFLRLGVDLDFCGEIDGICERTGIGAEIRALPRGDATLMSDLDASGRLVRGIALARVLATNASLILLDEPDASSRRARRVLLEELKALKGQATVILATHEPEFVSVADRVLVFNRGSIVRDCTPADLVRLHRMSR